MRVRASRARRPPETRRSRPVSCDPLARSAVPAAARARPSRRSRRASRRPPAQPTLPPRVSCRRERPSAGRRHYGMSHDPPGAPEGRPAATGTARAPRRGGRGSPRRRVRQPGRAAREAGRALPRGRASGAASRRAPQCPLAVIEYTRRSGFPRWATARERTRPPSRETAEGPVDLRLVRGPQVEVVVEAPRLEVVAGHRLPVEEPENGVFERHVPALGRDIGQDEYRTSPIEINVNPRSRVAGKAQVRTPVEPSTCSGGREGGRWCLGGASGDHGCGPQGTGRRAGNLDAKGIGAKGSGGTRGRSRRFPVPAGRGIPGDPQGGGRVEM